MSTRGTYRFRHGEGDFRIKTTIYIHCDNYPDGGALYLYKALCHDKGGGTLAEKFLRANTDAEITTQPRDHGDTEWHYEVSGSGPLARCWVFEIVRNWEDDFGDSDYFRLHRCGMLKDFIHAQLNSKDRWMEEHLPYHPFKEVYAPGRCIQYHNLLTARQLLDNPHRLDDPRFLRSLVACFPELIREFRAEQSLLYVQAMCM